MSDYNLHHPFLIWYASLAHLKAAEVKGKDLLLDDFAARRFGVGIVTDGKNEGLPVLGISVKDLNAVMSLNWTSAGIILGHNKRDWLALSAQDIRTEEAAEIDDVPLRLWVPFPVGTFDGWINNQPDQIQIRRIKNSAKSNRVIADKSVLEQIPVSLKNKW